MKEKLWTGYCQTNPSSWRTSMEGFIAFNEHLSLDEVFKMGFKTFVYGQSNKAVKYKNRWGNDVEIEEPVTNTVLVYPTVDQIKGMLKNSITCKGMLVVDGKIRTADGIESWLCDGCPRAVECVYDDSKKGDWNCKPPALENEILAKEFTLRSDTKQKERFAQLAEAMGIDIEYEKPFKDYNFKSLGRCDYAGYGGFGLKDINPLIHVKFDLAVKDNPAAKKGAATRRLKKEFCTKCFFNDETMPYYARKPIPMCIRYQSGVSERNKQFCWNTWNRDGARGQEEYTIAPAFMTAKDVDQVVADVMQKVNINHIKQWIYYGSRLLKKVNTKYYAFPEITQDFQWTGKYLLRRKNAVGKIESVTEEDLLKNYKHYDITFDSAKDVPDKIIPLYILINTVLLNKTQSMHDVLANFINMHTGTCAISGSSIPLVKMECTQHSVSLGFAYYHHTTYDFSNFKEVFKRMNPDGGYCYYNSAKRTNPVYFK